MARKKLPDYYQRLQIHPAAPPDLVTAAYWELAGAARNDGNGSSGRRLHQLSNAYAVLADVNARTAYDQAVGLPRQRIAPRLPRRGRLSILSAGGHRSRTPDHYEVIRVHPKAAEGVVEKAYLTMRDQYVRLVHLGHEPPTLLDALERAYEVTSDPKRRREYDAARRRHGNGKTRNGALHTAAKSTPTKAAAAQASLAKPASRRPAAKQTKRAVQAERQTFGHSLIALVSVARAIVSVGAIVARSLFGLIAFVVALLRPSPSRTAEPGSAVRRISPAEETALMARVSEAAGRSKTGDPPHVAGQVAHMVIYSGGPENGARYEVSSWPISVGAARDCDIVLDGLAPQQLRMIARESGFVLYSLSETPPVRVNGGDPVAWSALRYSDTISVGPYAITLVPVPR
jgi:curved DNA-binding protein CbpA